MSDKQAPAADVPVERKSSSGKSRSKDKARAEKVVIRNMSVTAIHRRLLGLVVVSALLAVSVCIVAVTISIRQVPPQYIQVTNDGRLMPELPLGQPNMDEAGISGFALEAIRAINTYDYLNWRTQINQVQSHFTPKGWGNYKRELDRVGTMRAVEERKQIVSFRPNGPVRLVNEGVGPDGLYTWDVEVPSIVSYIAHIPQASGTTGSNRQDINIRLRIKRMPHTLSPAGVAIDGYGYTLNK